MPMESETDKLAASIDITTLTDTGNTTCVEILPFRRHSWQLSKLLSSYWRTWSISATSDLVSSIIHKTPTTSIFILATMPRPPRTVFSGEREPLLQPSSTCQSIDSERPPIAEEIPQPINQYATADLCWILGGLWSAVFLGALDGWSDASIKCFNSWNLVGTIVATLLTPIGSCFNKFNQSSYIGTSYLLSVCCFTPLYGAYKNFVIPAESDFYGIKAVCPTSSAEKVQCSLLWAYLVSFRTHDKKQMLTYL
jgi:hypothetical protein